MTLPLILAASAIFASAFAAAAPQASSTSGDEAAEDLSLPGLNVSLGFDSFPERQTCDGEDLSPPVEISGLDESAGSIAIILEDPDAPRGTFVHWLIWNLVPSASIPEGIPPLEEVSAPEAVQGRNGFGDVGYSGPCPPAGISHRYVLKVFALDSKLDLPPGSGRSELEAAMEGRVLQSGEAVATYGR